jgi:acyl-CoA thioesterase-1
MEQIADISTYLGDLSALLSTEWPNNRTVNIVCHGHSVPAGYFSTPHVDTFNSYPHLLHVALKRRFPNALINVIVTAVGGENSLRGSERFDADVLCHHPDLVTIDYSLNDRTIGLEKAWSAWSSMVEKAIAAGAKVILLTTTPDTRSDLFSPDDPLRQHAEQVRLLAATWHVGMADSYKAFMARIEGGTDMQDLMSHVNHPNRVGHDIVAAELFKWFP